MPRFSKYKAAFACRNARYRSAMVGVEDGLSNGEHPRHPPDEGHCPPSRVRGTGTDVASWTACRSRFALRQPRFIHERRICTGTVRFPPAQEDRRTCERRHADRRAPAGSEAGRVCVSRATKGAQDRRRSLRALRQCVDQHDEAVITPHDLPVSSVPRSAESETSQTTAPSSPPAHSPRRSDRSAS